MFRLCRNQLTGFPAGVILESCTEVLLSVRSSDSQNMSEVCLDDDQYYHPDLIGKSLFSFEISKTYSTQTSLYSWKEFLERCAIYLDCHYVISAIRRISSQKTGRNRMSCSSINLKTNKHVFGVINHLK